MMCTITRPREAWEQARDSTTRSRAVAMDGQTYGRAATTTTTASASSDGDDDDDGKKIIDKKEQWHVAHRQIWMGTGARLDDAVARARDGRANLRVLDSSTHRCRRSNHPSVRPSVARLQSTTRRWTRARCARRRRARRARTRERDLGVGGDGVARRPSTVASRRGFVPPPTRDDDDDDDDDDERRAGARANERTTTDETTSRVDRDRRRARRRRGRRNERKPSRGRRRDARRGTTTRIEARGARRCERKRRG